MRIKSLGLKISLIVALMIAAIIAVVVYVVMARSEALVRSLTEKQSKAANLAFVSQMSSLQDGALNLARHIATDIDVVNAVSAKNADELQTAFGKIDINADTVVVCNTDGVVIARLNDSKNGDSVMDMLDVSTALKTGTGISTIERGANGALMTAGSSVVKDFSGNVIGAVSCGYDLTNPKYVDTVKEYSRCEATIFDGDTRVNSTLINEKGDRVIGTKATDTVINTVINKKQEFHKGIDIGALYGANIVAAEGGTVISAEWSGSYGNVVIVGHGNGLSTLYAHCSSLLVSKGAAVSKGQVIAKIGSTGYSTGNHLHFEVRLNGVVQDPFSKYLKRN